MTTTPERSVDEAIADLIATLQPIEGIERVPTPAALGRILAEDIAAPLDLPAFDNAAMDGYAMRAADLTSPALREIGTALAGHPFAGHVEPGACVRIMTGAPLPAGADTVVILEDTTREDGQVRIVHAPAAGANIRRRGEHVARGDIVLPSQRQLRTADLGLAAAIGRTELPVMRRLRVGILSTGDELADPPALLGPGSSYDANRPFLRASVERSGFEAIDLGICADRSADLERVLGRALAQRLDAVLISGGAAQGDADIVRRAGGVRFVPLNIRPGRGIAVSNLAQADHALALLGLPGNAVAAFVMFHLVARPVLLHVAGGVAAVPPSFPVPLASAVHVRGGRIDYRRARFVRDASAALAVAPLKDQGSAMLRTIVEADALIAVGPRADYAAGEPVETIPLAALD
ncbi:MAG: molybdopterin molybdotransferase MoeA [Burkholderiaceae bacterium]